MKPDARIRPLLAPEFHWELAAQKWQMAWALNL
jgi:hypothetical protein